MKSSRCDRERFKGRWLVAMGVSQGRRGQRIGLQPVALSEDISHFRR